MKHYTNNLISANINLLVIDKGNVMSFRYSVPTTYSINLTVARLEDKTDKQAGQGTGETRDTDRGD